MGKIPCEAYYYRIGSSIRRNRQEKGLTQEELAEAAGLSLKMVQKIEGGRRDHTWRQSSGSQRL